MDARNETARLVTAFHADVWNFLRLLGCDRASADDLTQETFLSVLEHPFEERSPAETAAWLRRVARWVFLNTLRAERRRQAREQVAAAERLWREVRDERGEDRRIEILRVCLESVDERGREALTLRYREGYTAEKSAERLGIKETALNVTVHRARERLRDCLERRSKA